MSENQNSKTNSKTNPDNLTARQLPGGTMEVVSKSGVEQTPENTGQLTRAMQNLGKVHVQGNQVTDLTVEEYNVGHTTAHEGSVLSTLRDTRGLSVNDHASIDLDNCVVRIGSMETSVRNALHMGYLSRDAQGNLNETNRRDAEVEAAQNQPEDKPMYLDPIMSKDAKSFVWQLKRNIGDDHLSDMLIMRAMNAAFLGKENSSAVQELASQSHLTDATNLQDDIKTLVQDITAHLEKEVKAAGGNGEEVKWLMSKADDHIKMDLIRRGYYGEGSCIKEIIWRYQIGNKR